MKAKIEAHKYQLVDNVNLFTNLISSTQKFEGVKILSIILVILFHFVMFKIIDD